MFFNSMGAYKGGCGGKEYDKGIFLELYNAPNVYLRRLEKEILCISNPRLNLCIAAHPNAFIVLLQIEKSYYGDGLSLRFLMNAPEPKPKSSKMVRLMVNESQDFEMLLGIIYITHVKAIHYKIVDEDAKDEFDKEYDIFQEHIAKCGVDLPLIR